MLSTVLKLHVIAVAAACALAGNAAYSGVTASPEGPFGADHASPELDEVVANLRAQAVGDHTVADFHLPESFLRGLADRILREAFEERFRMIVGRTHEVKPQPTKSHVQDVASQEASWIRFVERQARSPHSYIREDRPPVRGYRAPVLQHADVAWPFEQPGEDAPMQWQATSRYVARHLAKDGLLIVTARAMEQMNAHHLEDAQRIGAMRAVGLPVDLLEHFQPPQDASSRSVVEWIASQLMAGRTSEDLKDELLQWSSNYTQTVRGFRIATESGEHALAALRLQLTRGDDWHCAGDGGSIDLLRQLRERLPAVPMIASIERRHVPRLHATLAAWEQTPAPPLAVLVEDLPVAQWAQDNARSGWIADEGGAGAVLLAPRFASRGEDGSIFVPGESFLLDGLPSAGMPAWQSPLLFQGGNLLAVRHPVTGERLLLVGEAEIHRNTILGLTSEHVREAFRVEFGVDRCEILPAVSFHIDYDLTIRANGDRLLAFVVDARRGAGIVLRSALDAMQRAKLLEPEEFALARGLIDEEYWRALVPAIGEMLYAHADQFGRFSVEFAEQFSAGPADSGVGNLQRVLLALDTLAALELPLDEVANDVAMRDYLRSLRRGEAARAELRERLRQLGFELVEVPGLPGAARGINYVNGIHARCIYLMPAYGGLFAPLDEAAKTAFAASLGDDVRIVAIHCAETQRRAGALRCAVAPIYRP